MTAVQNRLRELRAEFERTLAEHMAAEVDHEGHKAYATYLHARREYFNAMHEALPSLLSPEWQASGWQPIETAPKSGESVFLAEPDAMGIGFWDEEDEQFLDYGGFPITFATHWMPLPPAPGATPPITEEGSA